MSERVGGDTRPVRLGKASGTVLHIVGGATIVVMMLFVVTSALTRTLLGSPVPATLEIVQYVMMPGLAALGIAAATLARRHIVADILFDRFPAAGRRWLAFATLLLGAAALAVLFWFTWAQAVVALERGVKAGYTDIPSWPLSFAISISLLASAVLFLRDAWIAARTPAEAETDRLELTEASPEELLRQGRRSGDVIS